MACGCKNKNKAKIEDMTIESINVGVDTSTSNSSDKNIEHDITLEPVILEHSTDDTEMRVMASVGQQRPLSVNRTNNTSVERDAEWLGLKQCYLCTKKHLAAAQILFGEYHTGYPDYIKTLIESTKVAESEVKKAFLLWQKIMAQLNMSENELLGKNANALKMREEHIALANKIRDARLMLSDDTLYSPDFDELLLDVHMLQHKVIENV